VKTAGFDAGVRIDEVKGGGERFPKLELAVEKVLRTFSHG
jgi:hypothetical protein